MNCIIDGRSHIGLESRMKRQARTLSGVGPPTQLLLGTRYLLTERRDHVRHLTISYADALVTTDSESVDVWGDGRE